ncbi:MAG: hypothetical protein ABIQ18_41625 [Umezawaea sp.]
MWTEKITEAQIAEIRKAAGAQPATGLPALAHNLQKFGYQIARENPAERIPYFAEAAAIYRSLVTEGADEHLNSAMRAISRLGMQYSLAHADDLALAAKHEAAALARRFNLHREGTEKEARILADLAHGLAESGQFAPAAATQVELVDIYRATRSPGGYSLPDNLAWSLLDLTVYLDLAGQPDASLEIEHEALALQRHLAEDDPGRLPALAIWTAGASLRLTGAGARNVLAEAIAACDQLPADGDSHGNFGFLRALQAAHFARSGTQDEQPDADHAVPIGVNPDQTLQPVLGLSFHHWSFSVRQSYRAGLDAINDAITADTSPLPLAELETLVRRRNIRESVLLDRGPGPFLDVVIPALAHSVDLERRLLAADPGTGPQRLVRALIDQAIGHLVISSNARAASALREAHTLCSTPTAP